MAVPAVVHPDFLTHIMTSGKFSDCTMTAGKTTFKLHKSIVCSQSPVLDAAFNGNFKESESCNIQSDFDVEVVRTMIRFLYRGGYNTDTCMTKEETTEQDTGGTEYTPTPPAEIAIFHMKVNVIADYYQIPRLVSLSRNKIDLDTIVEPEECIRVISAADSLVADGLLQQKIVNWMVTKRRSLFSTKKFENLDVSRGFYLRLVRTLSSKVPKCGHSYCYRCGT